METASVSVKLVMAVEASSPRGAQEATDGAMVTATKGKVGMGAGVARMKAATVVVATAKATAEAVRVRVEEVMATGFGGSAETS